VEQAHGDSSFCFVARTLQARGGGLPIEDGAALDENRAGTLVADLIAERLALGMSYPAQSATFGAFAASVLNHVCVLTALPARMGATIPALSRSLMACRLVNALFDISGLAGGSVGEELPYASI
jgi:hypothetical protein